MFLYILKGQNPLLKQLKYQLRRSHFCHEIQYSCVLRRIQHLKKIDVINSFFLVLGGVYTVSMVCKEMTLDLYK